MIRVNGLVCSFHCRRVNCPGCLSNVPNCTGIQRRRCAFLRQFLSILSFLHGCSLVHIHFQCIQIFLCLFHLSSVTVILIHCRFPVRHVIIFCPYFITFQCWIDSTAAPGIRQDQLTHIPLWRDHCRQFCPIFQNLCFVSAFRQCLTVCLCGICFPFQHGIFPYIPKRNDGVYGPPCHLWCQIRCFHSLVVLPNCVVTVIPIVQSYPGFFIVSCSISTFCPCFFCFFS